METQTPVPDAATAYLHDIGVDPSQLAVPLAEIAIEDPVVLGPDGMTDPSYDRAGSAAPDDPFDPVDVFDTLVDDVPTNPDDTQNS